MTPVFICQRSAILPPLELRFSLFLSLKKKKSEPASLESWKERNGSDVKQKYNNNYWERNGGGGGSGERKVSGCRCFPMILPDSESRLYRREMKGLYEDIASGSRRQEAAGVGAAISPTGISIFIAPLIYP